MTFFTSDWHLNSSNIVNYENRPFSDGHKMIDSYIRSINDKVSKSRDIMIHVGDFFHKGKSYYMDGDTELGYKADQLLDRIKCNVVLLEGNHDLNNTKFCHGRWMTVTLDKYKFATVGHYPSFDERFDIPYRGSSYENLHIHICGHVHRAFRFHLDHQKYILNVNVGVDAWNHNVVPLNKLNGYIDSYLSKLLKNKAFYYNGHKSRQND